MVSDGSQQVIEVQDSTVGFNAIPGQEKGYSLVSLLIPIQAWKLKS